MSVVYSQVENGLKRLYPQTKLDTLTYKDRPTLGLIPQRFNWQGGPLAITFDIEDTVHGAVSHDGTVAITNASVVTSKYNRMIIEQVATYAAVNISNQALKRAQGAGGVGFVDLLKREMDKAVNGLSNKLSIELFRDSTAVIGQLATGTSASATEVSLAEPDDIYNFFLGQRITASATAGGSPYQTSGADSVKEIVGIDYETGVIELDSALNATATNWGTTAYLYSASGDDNAALQGFGAWLPQSLTASNQTLNSLDRSVSRSKLAGVSVSYQGSIFGTLKFLLKKIHHLGVGEKVDVVVMNPTEVHELSEEAEARSSIYKSDKDGSNTAVIGFGGFVIMTDKGPVKVVGDRHCPRGRAYALQLDTWKLLSTGPLVQFDDMDGSKISRVTTDFAQQFRLQSFAQLYCTNPGANGVAALR